MLDEPARHLADLVIRDPHGVVDEVAAGLEVLGHAVDAHALDDGVDLLPAARALLLGGAVHDAVADLVVEAAALGVGEDDADAGDASVALEVARDAGDGAARAGASDEGVEAPAGLRHDLGARGGLVRLVVGRVLELVGEEAPARVRLGGRVLRGPAAREVDEVRRGGDGGHGDALDGGAEVVQQVRLLEGLVVGHADVRAVPPGPGERGDGDAGAADGALVDGVAAAGDEQAPRLGDLYHAQRHAVLGAVPGAVEELGLGEDRASRGRRQAVDLHERRPADAALDTRHDARGSPDVRRRVLGRRLVVLERHGTSPEDARSVLPGRAVLRCRRRMGDRAASAFPCPAALLPVAGFEVRIQVFETQRHEHAGGEGDGYRGRAVGSGVVA